MEESDLGSGLSFLDSAATQEEEEEEEEEGGGGGGGGELETGTLNLVQSRL
jgi:hypothetical protein